MIRWLLLFFGGALLGGVVHLATIMLLPRTATQDAYTRLSAIAPVNTVTALPLPKPPADDLALALVDEPGSWKRGGSLLQLFHKKYCAAEKAKGFDSTK